MSHTGFQYNPEPGAAEPSGAAACRVYVVELDREVLGERAFLAENPRYRKGRLCLYVGSTCLSPEERFQRHMRGHKANRFVYRYGIRLRPDYYHMYPPMSRLEAELTERELALELRAEGYGVWFNV
jgi:Uri superfamily endonuclease